MWASMSSELEGDADNLPQLERQPVRPLPQLEWQALELELQLA